MKPEKTSKRLQKENATDPGESIAIIDGYEEIIKNSEQENERICCETETDAEEVQRCGSFIIRVGLSRSSKHFKIRLLKVSIATHSFEKLYTIIALS